ncbi:MAG: hypothetical protein RL168_778, partial [Bacteroidota bacterium]
GFHLVDALHPDGYDAIVLAVSHDQFMTLDIPKLKAQKGAILYDVKGILPRHLVDARL